MCAEAVAVELPSRTWEACGELKRVLTVSIGVLWLLLATVGLYRYG